MDRSRDRDRWVVVAVVPLTGPVGTLIGPLIVAGMVMLRR
jgi:hypothetical protein